MLKSKPSKGDSGAVGIATQPQESHEALLARVRKEEDELLSLENIVCSHGDTVHYANRPQFFETCEGSYLYDGANTPFFDLQMWYSAVNLGYANKRVNDALKKQIDKLPQLACQYLHKRKGPSGR